MTSQKVLIVLTSHDTLGETGKETGFYLPEVTHPLDAFTRAGLTVDFVSPKGGKAPMVGIDLEDPLNKAFLENSELVSRVENTVNPAEIDPAEYSAIFYAGGHGTMWDFPEDDRLAAHAAAIYEAGGIVGAVCHGPAALVNIRLSNGEYLVANKTVSAFTNEEEAAVGLTEIVPFLLESKLIERGANFTKVPNFQVCVVTSDRLVTGQNPASAAGVGLQMVELLNNRAIGSAGEVKSTASAS
jgi:putative intracellular protease/amidase